MHNQVHSRYPPTSPPTLPSRRPHHFLSPHSSHISHHSHISNITALAPVPTVTKVLKGPKVLKVLIRAYRLRAQRRFQIPHSTHSSNITPIIPIVPIVPIAPTSLRPSAGNARAQPNSTFDIIMAFRIRHYKMSPGLCQNRRSPIFKPVVKHKTKPQLSQAGALPYQKVLVTL